MLCPICKSEVNEVFQIDNRPYSIFWKDSYLPKLNLKVSKCNNCDFLFQSSAYTYEYDEVMRDIYNSYFIKGDSSDTFPTPIENFKKEFDFINFNINFKNINSVLEIGSSRGDFLYNLKILHPHINILGIEPSNLKTQIPTIKDFFKRETFSNKFDFIIIRHVLEHIKNPKEFLEDVKSLLNLNGSIFIEVPNTIRDLKERVEIFTPDHVNYFTKSSIFNLAKSINCKIQDINDNQTNHLYTIFKNSPNDYNIQRENIDFLIKEYIKSINTTIKLIKEYSDNGFKIVFYGSSNLFIWAYSLISNYIDLNAIVVDNSKERIGQKIANFVVEDFNNLKDERVLFILSTSNRRVIEIMSQNINVKFNNAKIITIWEGIKE